MRVGCAAGMCAAASSKPASACPWKRVSAFEGETRLFIRPGYRFRAVDAMITNFHLPRSTLFMLVCAFAGDQRMRNAYNHAIAQHYRFYSYGDSSLLFRASDAP